MIARIDCSREHPFILNTLYYLSYFLTPTSPPLPSYLTLPHPQYLLNAVHVAPYLTTLPLPLTPLHHPYPLPPTSLTPSHPAVPTERSTRSLLLVPRVPGAYLQSVLVSSLLFLYGTLRCWSPRCVPGSPSVRVEWLPL